MFVICNWKIKVKKGKKAMTRGNVCICIYLKEFLITDGFV